MAPAARALRLGEKKMRKLFVVLVVVMLTMAACGDSSDSGSGSLLNPQGNSSDGDGSDGGNGDSDGNGGSGGSGSDFCQSALDLDESDAFNSFETLSFDAEFFELVDNTLAQIQSQAPNDQVRSDIGIFRDGLAELGSILAEFDYDITNPAVFTALADFDTTEMDAASARLDMFLEDECGMSLGASFDSTDGGGSLTDPGAVDELAEGFEAIGDNPALVEQLVAAFGIDLETAECLSEEFEDLDLDNPDPSILTLEVCGTTLLEVISNLGGG